MSFRRYEIILPTRYNDGTPVAEGEFWDVAKELVSHFGATSYLPEPVHGLWIHQGKTYEENNVRLFVDLEDTPENAAFFQRFKAALKERFRQIDIWMFPTKSGSVEQLASTVWAKPPAVLLPPEVTVKLRLDYTPTLWACQRQPREGTRPTGNNGTCRAL